MIYNEPSLLSNRKFQEDVKDKSCSLSPSNDTTLWFLPFLVPLFHQRLRLLLLQKHTNSTQNNKNKSFTFFFTNYFFQKLFFENIIKTMQDHLFWKKKHKKYCWTTYIEEKTIKVVNQLKIFLTMCLHP